MNSTDLDEVIRPEPASTAPVEGDSISKTRSRRRTLIVAVIAAVVMLCLCSGGCIIAGGWGAITGMIKANQAKGEVAAVIDEFMHDMVNKDAVAAYELFSTRAHRTVPLSKVETLLEDENYLLFDGYRSVQVDTLGLKKAVSTNPDLPQGTIAEVSGVVMYDGGITGKFTAVLEKQDDGWGLFRFQVVVPPTKFNSP